MAFKNAALNWLAATDRDSRLDFIREVFDCCQLEEVKTISSILVNAKKRKLSCPRLAQKRRKLADRQAALILTPSAAPASVLSAPASVLSAPASVLSAPASVLSAPASVLSAPASVLSAPASVLSAPASVLSAPASVLSASVSIALESISSPTAPLSIPRYWWQHYKKTDLLALDCEFVTLYQKQGNKHLNRPATVALIDYDGNVAYSDRIQHKKGTFFTDAAHVAITGFKSGDLEDGTGFNDVRKKLEGLMKDHLIITHGGYSDFTAFGFCVSDWDFFDLQSKFQQKTGFDKHGFPVLQPISLRRLVYHYFAKDIQQGVHSCEVDAAYTMKIFRKYQELCQQRGVTERYSMFEEDEFDSISKIK